MPEMITGISQNRRPGTVSFPRGRRWTVPGYVDASQTGDSDRGPRGPSAVEPPVCPPTIDSILDKSWFASDAESQAFVDKLIGYANGVAKRGNPIRTIKPDRYVEQGGWILLNPAGTQLRYQVKPTEQQDHSSGVYLRDVEVNKYVGDYLKKGWKVVAEFHTHVDRGNSTNEFDEALANQRKHPGFIIDFDGKTFAYGPKRGFRGIGVPAGCD